MQELKLTITMADKLVSTVWVDSMQDTYSFEYSDEWKQNGFAVSPHLKLTEPLQSGVIRRFLENLIPEGKGLEDIANFAHISKNNTFALIKAIGYDTSGALLFGELPQKYEAIFREIKEPELAERIEEMEARSIAVWDKKERLSLAGVQEKLPVILKDEKIGLGDGALSSTHIMKFQTKKHVNIVVNELFCMNLAKKVNMNVAEVALYRFNKHPVLMVKRFDRVYKEESVERLHVIDGCQMLDLSPSYKYERNFGSGRDVKDIRQGASFSKVFNSASLCDVPAKAKLDLLTWAMFNLVIGNSDAHGKNLSYFINEKYITLTPFYDILCILVHEDVEHDMAMAYGDEFDSDKVLAFELRAFSDDINMNFKLVSQTLEKVSVSIVKALESPILVDDLLLEEEKAFIEKLTTLILNRAEKFKIAALQMHKISY